MRLLVYGMQSSGATAFTRVLSERPDCVAMVDIANRYPAPEISTEADFVAKVVITTTYPLDVHINRFRPDRVLLLLRDPRDNYESLRVKPYGDQSGTIDEKFRLLDTVFLGRDRFDAVIFYEDFLNRLPVMFEHLAALGWPITADYYRFRRSYDELLGTLWKHEPHLRNGMDTVFGNARGREVTDKWRWKNPAPEIESRLEFLCPALLAHYRDRDRRPV